MFPDSLISSPSHSASQSVVISMINVYRLKHVMSSTENRKDVFLTLYGLLQKMCPHQNLFGLVRGRALIILRGDGVWYFLVLRRTALSARTSDDGSPKPSIKGLPVSPLFSSGINCGGKKDGNWYNAPR